MPQLEEQCVILEMQATSKDEALQELVEAVHSQCADLDPAALLTVLQEREEVGSTGVGNGIAIPHGKVPGLGRFLLGFGRSSRGVNFESVDNRPVHLFILILSPTGKAGEYLQTLARISRLLTGKDNRKRLLAAREKQDILAILNAADTRN